MAKKTKNDEFWVIGLIKDNITSMLLKNTLMPTKDSDGQSGQEGVK